MTIHFGDSTSIATATGLGAGILQVKQTLRTSTFSDSVAEAGESSRILDVSITPSSSSNKILVIVTAHMALNTTHGRCFSIKRGNTSICIGDAANNRNRRTGSGSASNSSSSSPVTMMFLDDPQTTSALTYGITLSHNENNTLTAYLNRTDNDNDQTNISRFASTCTVMELASGIL